MAGSTAAPAVAAMPASFVRTSLPGRIVFGDDMVTRLREHVTIVVRRESLCGSGSYTPVLAVHAGSLYL